jgi:polyhydroxybutyrate depolymerase
MVIDGRNRDFFLHVPESRLHRLLGWAHPYPLVIALHGSGANGETIRRQSGLDSIAEAQGWLVAYPNGVGGALGFGSDWNAGNCCGIPSRDSVNDIRFIVAVIDDLSIRFPINQRRVYVAGFSAGGRMAYHVACRAAPRIAAFAVVAGSLRDSTCVPTRPVALIAFHGTDDEEVPYDEPSDTPLRGRPIETKDSLPPSVQKWASINGCTGLRKGSVVRDVSRFVFIHCRADVELYSIAGGGHGWPGEPDGAGADKPLSEIHATQLMVQFFNNHKR